MMETKERHQQEQRIREALTDFFGNSYREAEFYYSRTKKGILITYDDFKPEREIKEKVADIVGKDWNIVLKREFSDLTIMMTLLKLYKENRVAIVGEEDGELKPYTIRAYVYKRMAES